MIPITTTVRRKNMKSTKLRPKSKVRNLRSWKARMVASKKQHLQPGTLQKGMLKGRKKDSSPNLRTATPKTNRRMMRTMRDRSHGEGPGETETKQNRKNPNPSQKKKNRPDPAARVARSFLEALSVKLKTMKVISSLKRNPTTTKMSRNRKESLKHLLERAIKVAMRMTTGTIIPGAGARACEKGHRVLVGNRRLEEMLQMSWPRSCTISREAAPVADCKLKLCMRSLVGTGKMWITESFVLTSSFQSKRQRMKSTNPLHGVVEAAGVEEVAVGNAHSSRRMVPLEAAGQVQY